MALNRFVLASAAALALAACSSSSSTSSSGSSSSTSTTTGSTTAGSTTTSGTTTTTGSTTTGTTTATSTTASSSSTGGMTMGTTGSSASGSTGGTTGPSSSSSSTGGSTGGSFVITIQNLQFTPANLDVPVGATVTVQNMDGFPHTVTSSADTTSYSNGAVDGVTFDVSVGGGVTKTFAVSGGHAGDVVPYFCNIHTSGMVPNHATITLH